MSWAEATRPVDHLDVHIKRHVVTAASRPTDRPDDVMHPSQMIKKDWCHRDAALTLRHGEPTPAATYFTRENIFEEGHNSHRKWQKWLQEMGRLAGMWHCRVCDQTYWDDESPVACQLCSAPAAVVEYAEVPLSAPELRIGGTADGYCPQDNCLIEIKTMGVGGLRLEEPELVAKHEYAVGRKKTVDLDGLWAAFDRPLASAYRQGQLYLWIAIEVMHLPVDRITFIYDWKPTGATKFLTYLYDPSASVDLIAAAADIVDLVDHFGELPPCNVDPAGCRACLRHGERAA